MSTLRLLAVAALLMPILSFADAAQAIEQPARAKVEQRAKRDQPPEIAGEQPGDRARRLMDLQADRLERDARKAMQSICRGC